MTTYQITSRGNLVGTYKGKTPDEALQAMAEDAGYDSLTEACEAGSSRPEDFQVWPAEEVDD